MNGLPNKCPVIRCRVTKSTREFAFAHATVGATQTLVRHCSIFYGPLITIPVAGELDQAFMLVIFQMPSVMCISFGFLSTFQNLKIKKTNSHTSIYLYNAARGFLRNSLSDANGAQE